MDNISGVSLAILLIALGLAFWLVTRALMYLAPRMKPAVLPQQSAAKPVDTLTRQKDAILIVQPGGRIFSINDRARKILGLAPNEIPNLQRLAKRARPAEDLLSLCATEGQARFLLDGRLVIGSSYVLPIQPENLVVVSLRYPDLSTSRSGDAPLPPNTLQTFNELTQSIAGSLELEGTLQAIFESVGKMIPADFMEVTIWNSDVEALLPYRYLGFPGAERKLTAVQDRYKVGEGYSGYLAKKRTPLLISDVDGRTDIRPAVDRKVIPIRSYVGVPLFFGEEFIGTIELASMTVDAFTQDDISFLGLLSGHVANALNNSLRYESEKQRTLEISGLSQLSQALSSVRDPKSLFSKLVETIAPLIPVQILGFLLYNESQRVLVGQQPFHGLPEQFMELYRVPVHYNSAIEKALLEQDVVITENAMEDPRWEELGFGHVIQATSMRDSVLVPLASGGRMLGYIQASNHTDGRTVFTPEELRFLTIVANQAAPIIENALLVQQSRQRAQRAEALRRIGSLASSAANLDEILKFSLQEVSRLVGAESALVFLLDRERGSLAFHQPSYFSSHPEPPPGLLEINVDDPEFPFTSTGRQHYYLSGNLIEGQTLIPFYQRIIDYLKLESILIVPLVVRDEGIGEIWLGSSKSDFFEQSDLQMLTTAAGQLAGVVEQSYLSAQTDESLRRQVEQQRALTRISRELSKSLDIRNVLQLVYDEAIRTTGADCGTLLLLETERPLEQEPQISFYVGDVPAVKFSPVEEQALRENKTINLPDVAEAAYTSSHEGVASALLVPIQYQQKMAGLISLHSNTKDHFDETAVDIAQSLASQAALALGNAFQFEKQAEHSALLKRELETLGNLFRVSQTIRAEQPLETMLAVIADAIRSATPFNVVLISLYRAEDNALHRMLGLGIPEDVWQELKARPQPWQGIQVFLEPEFRIGAAYFIAADRRPLAPADVHTVTLLPTLVEEKVNAWHPDDLLLVPLFDADGSPLGLISVDAPRDNVRPDKPTFEALELFAGLTSLLIENHQKTNALRETLVDLSTDKVRLQQALEGVQREMPKVQQENVSQFMALQRLERQMERIQVGLDIAELTNRQTDPQAVLRTLGSEFCKRFGMAVVLFGEMTKTGARLTEIVGEVPEGVNPEALFGQRNPLRQVMQDGKAILISKLDESKEWNKSPLLNALEAKSIITLPLTLSVNKMAGMLAIGLSPLPPFVQDEDAPIFHQLARQVSVGLQNIHLFNETQRRLRELDLLLAFTRKLGVLDPVEVLDSLVETAAQTIAAADAIWVALWDEKSESLVARSAHGYMDRESLLQIHFRPPEKTKDKAKIAILPLKVFMDGVARRVEEVKFAQDYALPADDLLLYRKATGGRLPVSSMLVPMGSGERNLGVLVLDNYNLTSAFSDEDEALAISLAQQSALALENARLFISADSRASQLQALTQIAGTITSSMKSEDLIQMLLDQTAEILPYQTATLWLREGESLQVAAARGFEDNESRLGIAVNLEDSKLFQEMVATGQVVSVPDVRADERFQSLVEPDNLSWLGIPLIAKAEMIGVIALEKKEADFYTADHLRAATTFASQAAVSLDNARLFEDSLARAAELDQRSQRLALLNKLSTDLTSSLDIDVLIRLAAEQLMMAMGATRVAAVLRREKDEESFLVHSEFPAGEDAEIILPATELLKRLAETQGVFSSSDILTEKEIYPLDEVYFEPLGTRAVLIVPLFTGVDLQGWFFIQHNEEHRFSAAEIELARTISNQTAVAVQNARLYAETRSLTTDLERRVEERTTELRREHQNTQTLLRVITELSSSLDLNQVLIRTLNVLNESLDAEQGFVLLLSDKSKVYQAGKSLAELQDERSPVQQIAKWIVKKRVSALIDDVRADERWKIEGGDDPGFRSAIAVPIMMGEEVLGSMMMIHPQPNHFLLEQISLVEVSARQVGVSLNNAELFNLIRDQAESLGSMLRDQQIEASRSRAILEAVADGVLVTDANNRITLFNASAERILDLKADQVMGKSLEQFMGLFGQAAKAWSRTIRNWSQEPGSYDVGEVYSEQLNLDNGKFVSVHLAAVIWRQQFLGTVSTFRDITHEVRVDRLKSEFVANVSHELRTPMTSIKGYAEVLLMGAAGQLLPQQEHFLKVIKTNTERLGVLVNDLLDISRIETGRVVLNLQPLNLAEIAEEVLDDLDRRSQEENKPMQFNIEVSPDLPPVVADAERVRQVLYSLVSNGYNYTPANGLVTVRIQKNGDEEIEVHIQDNGIGITKEQQPRIFQRFYRGEDPLVLETAGTGLGLATSKALVEMHHGRIWFTSTGVPGEGSVFSFTLPIRPPEE